MPKKIIEPKSATKQSRRNSKLKTRALRSFKEIATTTGCRYRIVCYYPSGRKCTTYVEKTPNYEIPETHNPQNP